MKNQEITVLYSWKAMAGKSEELKAAYKEVTNQMKQNEPNALKVECNFDETRGVLSVYDLFKDGEALGLHLGTTAAGHFPSLLQIAEPGTFFFCGEVPDQLKQAITGMGLDAVFAPHTFGFDRRLPEASN
jgi:hypothetical protein